MHNNKIHKTPSSQSRSFWGRRSYSYSDTTETALQNDIYMYIARGSALLVMGTKVEKEASRYNR